MAEELSPTDKMKAAIINLQKPQPFFAHLLMAMKFRPMPQDFPSKSRTMCVNARGDCWYDEEFVKKLTVGRLTGYSSDDLELGELEGVVCHEVLHVALEHFVRTGGRDHQISNLAQDAVINPIVLSNAMPLPTGTVPWDRGRDVCEIEVLVGDDEKSAQKVVIKVNEVSKKPWEQVYEDIMEQLDRQTKGKKKGQGGYSLFKKPGFDEHDRTAWDQLTDEEKKQVREEWVQRLTDAATYAKQQGKLPAGIDRFVDDLVNPKVSWKEVLVRHIKTMTNPVDWSYDRPSRKTHALGIYLPRVVKETVEVDVLIDTSGSIGGPELTEFFSEMVGMQQQMPYLKMHVSFCDAEVIEPARIPVEGITDIMQLKPKGGGGTSMEAGLDYIKENGREVEVVVVLTDGCDSWKGSETTYPFQTVWVISERGISKEMAEDRIPYGAKVKIE